MFAIIELKKTPIATVLSRALLGASLAAGASAAYAGDVKLGETAISWGGYIKFDMLYSKFSEGEVAQSTSRDFYVPGTIPVSAGAGESHSVLDMHAKETRLFIKSATELESGDKLGTHIEFDFIVSQGAGNEIVTNAYNPGLRRAFVTWNNWLFGQDWSTFENLGSLPETLDFVAWPTDGTVFMRQPMVRYTAGSFQIALENTETTVLAPGAAPAIGATNDAQVPDIVARYTLKAGASEFVLAGLVRQLAIDNDAPAPGVDDTATAGGVSLSGKIPLGSDDIRFTLTGGDGIGRYVAIGTSADSVLDAGGDLEPIGVTAGFVAYRHVWNPKWRSTLTASAFQADNDTALTGTNVTKSVRSASVNLLYSPVAKLTLGTEFRHAEREREDDQDGSLDRLQFSAKYAF